MVRRDLDQPVELDRYPPEDYAQRGHRASEREYKSQLFRARHVPTAAVPFEYRAHSPTRVLQMSALTYAHLLVS